jgi:hypothetical protein
MVGLGCGEELGLFMIGNFHGLQLSEGRDLYHKI